MFKDGGAPTGKASGQATTVVPPIIETICGAAPNGASNGGPISGASWSFTAVEAISWGRPFLARRPSLTGAEHTGRLLSTPSTTTSFSTTTAGDAATATLGRNGTEICTTGGVVTGGRTQSATGYAQIITSDCSRAEATRAG